ncbi:MAG TPA: serine/threonine-protein kinase [Pyrinomonadaceae bacterium]|nr:serine/threonine protein kinase [Acidobacteriota bacterium]HQZ97738.1 serine/threonine-protein kinase [Pyrinomonadaceae bacterium]
MKALNPNSMIQGRYLVVQPIGKGGMGEVYLAVDQRLGSAVALKRTFFSEDSTLGSAFEREARILARLRHPVLPKVIDHFAENGDQFLVMEHISGDDIAKRMESANKPFPLSWVMFWADQMLDALAYLHSHEPPIVHRDIKPQNLKLTDDNHIVLLDFGLSKDFDSKASGLNSASVAGYSPHFASMEQIRGTGTDARSDLYSLAATLYQMLTNVIPPDALTRADSMLGGKGDPIKPLNELNSEITPAISEVILKAVAIRQDERFGSAVEMQKALRRAFNKDKADLDAKPVMVVSGATPPAAEKAAVKPDPEQHTTIRDTPEPEMETQIRLDTPTPLDATMQLQFGPEPAEVKQSELKTAVFSAGELSEDQGPSAQEAATKVKTQPVVEPPASAPAAVAASAAAGSGAGQVSRHEVKLPPAKQPQSPAAQKSKAGLIVGVLVALLLLGGGGGGAAWFLMKRSNAGVTVTPAPTPAPTPISTPVVAADTNPANNSNSAAFDTSNSNASNGNSTVSTTSTPVGTKPTPSLSTKETPVKTTQAPAAKATPKAKAKDDRTTILQ